MSEFTYGPDGQNQGPSGNQNSGQPMKAAADAVQLPPQFEKISDFSLKVNPYTVWTNVIGAVLFIAALVGSVFLFPVRDAELIEQILYWALMVLGGVLLALVALVLSCLLKLALLKGVGGGKCKLYFGLVIDVYAEQPVKRNSYFLADFIAMLIPFCAIVVLMIFFWNAIFFIAFAFLLINVIGNIPVYIFELKLPKDAFFWLNRGILYALKKV